MHLTERLTKDSDRHAAGSDISGGCVCDGALVDAAV